MSEDAAIKRQILRSTSIIGGATIAGLVIGLVKMKVVALLVGTVGIGLLGALTSLLTMGASIAGMGIDSSAVRQLATAAENPDRLRIARWAIWTYAWPLAIAGSVIFWLFRANLSQLALGSADYSEEVGWLAIGVGATVIGAAQIAHVQAWRRIGDLARIRVISAMLAAVVSILAIYQFGIAGILAAVLITPVATCLAASWFSRSLPAWDKGRFPGRRLAAEWRILAGLGTAVTLTTIVGSATQTAVRGILASTIGLDAAGLFQAAFAISSLNLGLVLGAMVPEYYPRLSAAADDPKRVGDLLNHQVHVGLLLAGPALVAISALAPLLLQLLYSADFSRAALLLRLQVTADALRIAGWALGFVLLARKRTAAYVLVEVALAGTFLPLTWLGAGRYGLESAGGAYLLGYAVSLLIAGGFAYSDGIRIDGRNSVLLASLVILLIMIAISSAFGAVASLVVGLVALATICFFSLRELHRLGITLSWVTSRLQKRNPVISGGE